MTIPNYITQLTRRDLEEIAAASNAVIGPGIDIEKGSGFVKFSVNQSQFRRWVRAFVQNGGLTCDVSAIDTISLDLS